MRAGSLAVCVWRVHVLLLLREVCHGVRLHLLFLLKIETIIQPGAVWTFGSWTGASDLPKTPKPLIQSNLIHLY